MIIKIDHIALTADSLKFYKLIYFFEDLGYKLNFLEKNVKNLGIKRALMREFSPKHDLALLTSAINIDIEVINHGHVNESDSNITPIFDNLPIKFIENRIDNNIAKLKKLIKIKYFYSPVYVKNNRRREFGFNNLIIETSNIGESIKFWNIFNFKTIEANNNSAILEFNSLFKDSKCKINLERSKKISERTFLDDDGFNCFAFVSNSTEKEKKRIDGVGVKTTKIETIKINKRKLDIFFALGNQGEIAEVIGVK